MAQAQSVGHLNASGSPQGPTPPPASLPNNKAWGPACARHWTRRWVLSGQTEVPVLPGLTIWREDREANLQVKDAMSLKRNPTDRVKPGALPWDEGRGVLCEKGGQEGVWDKGTVGQRLG